MRRSQTGCTGCVAGDNADPVHILKHETSGCRQSATHAHLVAMVGHWWPLGQAEQLALRFPEAKKPALLRQRNSGALGRARLDLLLGSRAQLKQLHYLPPARQLWMAAQQQHQPGGWPMRSPGAAVAAAGRGVKARVALLAGGGAAAVGVCAGGARLRAGTDRQAERRLGLELSMRGRFLQVYQDRCTGKTLGFHGGLACLANPPSLDVVVLAGCARFALRCSHSIAVSALGAAGAGTSAAQCETLHTSAAATCTAACMPAYRAPAMNSSRCPHQGVNNLDPVTLIKVPAGAPMHGTAALGE